MKWSFTFMLSMLCLGLATSAQAQGGTTDLSQYTCAFLNQSIGARQIPIDPDHLQTFPNSTGGTTTLLQAIPLNAVPGDTVTITLSPGVSDPNLTPPATLAKWRLETLDPALLDGTTQPITLPPTTVVASGGALGSMLTYKATATGLIALLIAVDELDGYATLTVGCTPFAPSAVPGVKVDLGGLPPKSSAFPADSDTLTFTFDIAADDKVKALLPGQSVTLPITAVVDPELLTSCGCIANTLNGEVTYTKPAVSKTEPTPVPTLSEITLAVLGLLVVAVAMRSGAGRHGLKALAVLGLGAAMLFPGHDLRAAGGNALESIDVKLDGTVVTVTVKRNPDCKVNRPPVMPESSIVIDMTDYDANPWTDDTFTTRSTQLPAATDAEGNVLTYSMPDIPSNWSFDPSSRTLTWPGSATCYVDAKQTPLPNSFAGQKFEYKATDQCGRHAIATVTCESGEEPEPGPY